MVKEKRILSYFIGWLILGLFICFIGVSDVFADEMERVGFLSDKSEIKVVVPYNGQPLTLDQYGEYMLTDVDELLIFIDNYSFSKDNIYQLELYLPNATLTNANTFSVSGSNSNNNNVSCRAIKILQDNKQYVNFRWSCSENVNNLAFTITNSNNENIVKSGIFKWDYTFLWNVLSTEDNSDIINGLDNIQQSIIDSNKETQEVIKNQFNSCRDSVNLFNKNNIIDGWIRSSDNKVWNETGIFSYTDYINVNPNTTYTLNLYNITSLGSAGIMEYDSNKNWLNIGLPETKKIITFTTSVNTQYIRFTVRNEAINYIQLQEGSVSTNYEPYGEKICTNKLDEQNETSKGIWETIKNLPNAFMDMLKGLFIPEDGYFELWFNDLKMFFEDKLGFLATPFTIIIDFVNRYLDLNPSEDIIINIPDITVPNFEDHIIVKATTFNWSQLLKSKDSLNTLWQLYLSFVDVFLILNFINLCENKYNRIFGGDTTQYEYYTVEDSYNVDVNTGEIKSQRRNERTTTRKKVN